MLSGSIFSDWLPFSAYELSLKNSHT